MAGFACGRYGFVTCIGQVSFNNFRMAFGAGNVPVFPVQGESCEGMVEQPCLPVEVIMAFQARSSLCPELPVVYLPVAFQAVCGEPGKFLDRGTCFTGIYMAGSAGLFLVFSFQVIAGKGMVERDVTPAGFLMAYCALFVRVVL